MSDDREVDWVCRRDDFDVLLGRAANLLMFSDCTELAFLLEGYCKGHTGYLPPATFLRYFQLETHQALDDLRCEAYREGRLAKPELVRLLARIGAPALMHSADASGRHEVEDWPEPDWQATRKDVLHFYLLAKAVYVDLKAKLQNRAVQAAELTGLTEGARKLLENEMASAESIEGFKEALIQSWQQVKWVASPPFPPPDGRERLFRLVKGLLPRPRRRLLGKG